MRGRVSAWPRVYTCPVGAVIAAPRRERVCKLWQFQAAPEDVRAFIQEYFDAWKGTDEHKILAFYSDDVVLHLPTGTLEGKTAVRDKFVRRSSPGFLATYMPFGICGKQGLTIVKDLSCEE